jgi:predicted AlkP superfamily pyrophosphatase or phosphodiesterase
MVDNGIAYNVSPSLVLPDGVRMKLASILFALGMLILDGASAAPPVLLISIDGLRPDYVTQADKHGLQIPNLRRFLAEGTHAEGVTGVVPTITYPSHTTLVTGVRPAVHGIYANLTFDPLQENLGGWYWYASDEKVPTLWQAADRAGMVTASVNWPVTVSAPGIRYNLAEYWRAGTSEDLKLLEAISQPDGFLSELEAKLGPYVDGLREGIPADAIRTKFTAAILADKKPGFMTVHLIDLDGASHEHGPFSKEANASLEALDGMIGQLRDAAVANDPGTVVAIVSDHGFFRTDHRFNWRIPLVAAGLLKLKAPESVDMKSRIAAWDATLWVGGGSAAVMLRNPDDRIVAAKVKGLLDRLKRDPKNGIARILDREELKKYGGWPDATFLVELDPDYQFGNAWSGALITPAASTGMHGYLPDRPEMNASFFIAGVGIAAGRNLGIVDMRQIAPTLAAILGVQLPTAEMPKLDVAPEH